MLWPGTGQALDYHRPFRSHAPRRGSAHRLPPWEPRNGERSFPMLPSTLRNFFGRNKRSRSSPKGSFIPRLLQLEERALPSTFTVTNLNDQGAGSLRQAVQSANQNPGADAIVFQPGITGVITLTSG